MNNPKHHWQWGWGPKRGLHRPPGPSKPMADIYDAVRPQELQGRMALEGVTKACGFLATRAFRLARQCQQLKKNGVWQLADIIDENI
ncbi:MAG: hypothetical protein LBR80_05910 [Deltaproteobacteria bacterium]|nr:hypothetical protein [Deltaproteobacteria bacterium]